MKMFFVEYFDDKIIIILADNLKEAKELTIKEHFPPDHCKEVVFIDSHFSIRKDDSKIQCKITERPIKKGVVFEGWEEFHCHNF